MDDEPRGELLKNGESRRQFLKKGAATGAVVWAAPAIVSLPGAAAFAAGTPRPCPECPACDAEATAVAVGNLVAVQEDAGCTCLANVALGSGSPSVTAQVACASADDAACQASAFLAGLRIQLAPNTFLTATVLSSCVHCGTGRAFVADLALLVGTVATPLQLSANCNGTVLGLGTLATAVFNEQTCTNGVLTVNALRVTVAGINVIVGQSRAGAAGCRCEPCSPLPDCTPPRERLC